MPYLEASLLHNLKKKNYEARIMSGNNWFISKEINASIH